MWKASDDFVYGLYQTHYKKLFCIAYRMLGDVEQAQDVVQDVFLQVVFHQSKLAAHPNPEGWLVVTLRNMVQNERRRSTAHPVIPLDSAALVPGAEPGTPLEMALPTTLSPEDRSVLIWRFEQEMSYQEIADRLGISESGCRSRVSRAVARCRKLVEKE